MKKLLLFLSLAPLLVIGVGLSPKSAVPTAAAEGATQQTVQVYNTPDAFQLGSPVEGAYAILVRNKTGITTNLHTTAPAGAYTLWWVVFNDPANECTSPDDMYPCEYDIPDIVVWAAGGVNETDGSLNLSGTLKVDDHSPAQIICPNPDIFDFCPGPGLTNPSGAVVQLVLRYEGPVTPGLIYEQTRNFFGPGCGINPDGSEFGPCFDPQLSYPFIP
jgi:hypothetical protein